MIPLHLDVLTAVSLAVSVILPLLSSLLAKAHWPSEVVGIITLLLAALNGFGVQWLDAGTTFDWRKGAEAAVVSFAIAVASRYGLWKGTKTDATALRVGSGVRDRKAA